MDYKKDYLMWSRKKNNIDFALYRMYLGKQKKEYKIYAQGLKPPLLLN